MSEQPDAFLKMDQSYKFNAQKTQQYSKNTIDPSGFYKWSQPYMYKSSYAHYHSKDSLQPKTTAIPGYTGYVPSIKAQNIHARGFSAMAKQSFQNQKLGKNQFGLASTGFNLNKQALIDTSKAASSSKYGKSQIQKAHPGWNAQWRSTTHQAFKNPNHIVSPTYHQTDKWVETKKKQTKTSGFSANHDYFDGTGWKPDPVLKGDNNRTQYRDRFNTDHSFHRNTYVSKVPQLPKKQLTYRYN